MYDVIVIGAGASGLMFSNFINTHLKVLILEKKESPGKKLLITGGGRCNLTNNKEIKDFLENVKYNHKYLYSTLTRFGPKDIMNYFKISLKEEKENQIFPVSNNAGEVLNFLLKNKKCNISYNEEVVEINKNNDIFNIITNKCNYKTKRVVVATGGCSFPSLGSSGDHIKFAKSFNQEITPVFPAETSINTLGTSFLTGTSFDNIELNFNNKNFSGNLIYTHTGLSGVSIMKASEHIYLDKVKEIKINYLPDYDLEMFFESNRDKSIGNALTKLFTKKFALHLLNKSGVNSEINVKSLNKGDILKIINIINNDVIKVSGVNSLSKAYITGGGISLKGVDTKTFESKIVSNMYYIGEALDIHGPVGGYNLTLAFSTAYSCAIYINESI